MEAGLNIKRSAFAAAISSSDVTIVAMAEQAIAAFG